VQAVGEFGGGAVGEDDESGGVCECAGARGGAFAGDASSASGRNARSRSSIGVGVKLFDGWLRHYL